MRLHEKFPDGRIIQYSPYTYTDMSIEDSFGFIERTLKKVYGIHYIGNLNFERDFFRGFLLSSQEADEKGYAHNKEKIGKWNIRIWQISFVNQRDGQVYTFDIWNSDAAY